MSEVLFYFNGKEIDTSCLRSGWLEGEEPKIGDTVLKVRVKKHSFGDFYKKQCEVFLDKLHPGNWNKNKSNTCYSKKSGIVTPVRIGKYGQIYSFPVEEFILLFT